MSINSEHIPYTYLIGWAHLDLWYYGSRTAKKDKCMYKSGCHPDDLFETYFTSSSIVHDMIIQYGMPNIIQIRKRFPDNPDKALYWEKRVLKRMKLPNNPKWLNSGYITCVPNSWANKTLEEKNHHARNIMTSLRNNRSHNVFKENRRPGMGNEFTPESSSILQRKRVEDGTHNLLGGEIATKSAKKRLDDGTHNFLTNHPMRKKWKCSVTGEVRSKASFTKQARKNGLKFWPYEIIEVI